MLNKYLLHQSVNPFYVYSICGYLKEKSSFQLITSYKKLRDYQLNIYLLVLSIWPHRRRGLVSSFWILFLVSPSQHHWLVSNPVLPPRVLTSSWRALSGFFSVPLCQLKDLMSFKVFTVSHL